MDGHGFDGLRVLSFESRRGQEMGRLIANHGGRPMIAPSLREVPLGSNTAALEFAGSLMDGRLDMVIFLTGVGTRALTRVVETAYPRQRFIEALGRVAVVARGPKPAAALREMEVPISLLVPEPNTWRELLRALDEQADVNFSEGRLRLRNRRVAVQEYGVSNRELLAALEQRGASVMSVPVYEWTLPEDTGPLRAAVKALAASQIDVAMFTSSAQVNHLLQIAQEMEMQDQVLHGLARAVVASIGPVTSETLKQHGIHVDLAPTHPRMGFLVNETAQQSGALLRTKRGKI